MRWSPHVPEVEGGLGLTGAQPASRVNLSRLLLVAAGVTSQYFTGQREGTDQYCQSLTAHVDTHNHCYKEVHLHHHQPPIVP